jgi:hypothetical protein
MKLPIAGPNAIPKLPIVQSIASPRLKLNNISNVSRRSSGFETRWRIHELSRSNKKG